MRKILSKICTGLLAGIFMAAFTSCGSEASSVQSDELKVVSTIFPGYDWASELMSGSDHSPSLLIKNGADMHSFQPTAADIVSLSDADLFIYVGGESDSWVEDALSSAQNENMVTVNMMDVLGNALCEEEEVEGMESDSDEEEELYDEHVWLSPENAKVIVSAIAEALESVDSAHSNLYKENASSYTEKLSNLSDSFRETVDSASNKTLLFGDRFPFLYLTKEYGLEYYAAFPGCSSETEASFATISFLAGKMDELNLPYILTIDGGDGKIASTIIENTESKSAEILTLDSMQAVTDEEIENGASYLSIMEENLNVIRKALGVDE